MPFDAYLWIDGVEGESTAEKMEKKTDIISFSFGASNPSTVSSGKGGLAAGKVHVSGFNIMKKMDAASNVLFAHCCTGDHFKKAEVILRKSGGASGQQVFLKYEFEHVMVDSIQWSGSQGGDDSPTESVQFAFANFKTTYTKFGTDGKSKGNVGPVGWDLTKNAKM